ncbi:MAG: hypothetical protein II797_05120 [Clostridia bacterium]|nr:hypothetical protein [Clostridia bacterium]
MKRRIFALLLAALLLLTLLAGCVKAEAVAEINLFGRISIQIILALYAEDDSNPTPVSEVLPEGMIETLEKNGFTATTYNKDHFVGIFLENKNFDPKNIQKGEEGSGLDISFNPTFVVKDGILVVDLPLESFEDYIGSLSSMKESIEEKNGGVKISITAPVKPTAHNATGTANGGKTLIWNLLELEDRKSIHLEYSIASFALIWGAIILGAILVIVLVPVILVKVLKKKKEDKAPENAAQTAV